MIGQNFGPVYNNTAANRLINLLWFLSSLSTGNQIVKNLFYDDMQVQTIYGLNSSINKASFFNISENGWVIYVLITTTVVIGSESVKNQAL